MFSLKSVGNKFYGGASILVAAYSIATLLCYSKFQNLMKEFANFRHSGLVAGFYQNLVARSIKERGSINQ